MRAHVARLLWRLLVGRAGLLPALAALRDYCLLARGDFWQSFLHESRALMAAPPRLQSVDADLAIPFSVSAAKSSAEGDPLLHAFRLRYLRGAEAESAFQIKNAIGSHVVPPLDPAWDPLVLEVSLAWPLGLLLGADSLRRYNALFGLLLRLRRMATGLDEAWKDLRAMERELRRPPGPAGGPTGPGSRAVPPAAARGPAPARLRSLQETRNHMAHVVTNLQRYLQIDVIEVAYSALEARISTCQDFSELERAHHTFLSTLMVQSFLSVKSLCSVLADMFADVQSFCLLVGRAGGDASRLDVDAAGRIRTAFQCHSIALFNNMSSQRILESFRSPHLAQLVTQLNYNEWMAARARMGPASVGVGTEPGGAGMGMGGAGPVTGPAAAAMGPIGVGAPNNHGRRTNAPGSGCDGDGAFTNCVSFATRLYSLLNPEQPVRHLRLSGSRGEDPGSDEGSSQEESDVYAPGQ
ncbi:GCP4 protein [Gonium pectorale]|uniref:Gamma-tubulin complex component n=1 Tax=Gonium pectorale TaxID=33097 RepID=A0A150GGI8_GONPE|nr:GCP4 protein [Gonium pectorale]|eukprot:KXZ48725.1 GCP4 protein [Gonium pectorale]